MKVLSKLKYLLLVPFIALACIAASWGLADLASRQLIEKEQEWFIEGSVKSYAEWKQATDWGRLAIKLNPYQARFYEEVGRVYFWRFFVEDRQIESFEQSQSVINEGAEYLRKAIEKRPTWPSTWAYLLRLKSIGGQIDPEFVQIWDRTIVLGDWEPIVQMTLLEAGLIHWPILDADLRERVLKIFVEMTSKAYSTQQAMLTVDRVGLWGLVCNELVDPVVVSDAMRTACQQYQQSLNENPLEQNPAELPAIPLIVN